MLGMVVILQSAKETIQRFDLMLNITISPNKRQDWFNKSMMKHGHHGLIIVKIYQFPQTVQRLMTVFTLSLPICIHISFIIKYSPKVSTRFHTFKSLTFDHNYFICVSSPLKIPVHIFSLWNVYLKCLFSHHCTNWSTTGPWLDCHGADNDTIICIFYNGSVAKSALTHFCIQNKQQRWKHTLLWGEKHFCSDTINPHSLCPVC